MSSYELQVSQSVQRGGIGKALVQCLCDIARKWDMQKVMLTVFKGDDKHMSFLTPILRRNYSSENQPAFLFYDAMGFVEFLVSTYERLIVYMKL